MSPCLRNIILTIGLTFIGGLLNAQNSSLQCTNYRYTTDTFILTDLPVLANSLDSNLVYFIAPNKAIFKKNKLGQDSILLCFRVLTKERFKTEYQVHDQLENDQTPRPINYNPNSTASVQNTEKIFSNGSVSRGISAGNNQGLLVNSDLNLQMQGDLGKGVMLTAAVSDNNSPLQPDGTTLQIQDFDKVFVKIAKDSWFAVAGDYFMKSAPQNHFLAFNKKSRGLQFEGTFNTKNGYSIINQSHAAVSRGRFARNEIQGVEGLQGPYRLKGTKNEAFIIVIAATEVVYLDGIPLTRGEQNDYVINYNAAELSFNPNKQITRNSRIVVEFQYADQSYSRVLFNEGIGVEKGRLKLRANYFIEQDNKNQPFQAENALSLFDSSSNQDAKLILANAGDDRSKAVISTTKFVKNFDNGKILYRKIDSLSYSDVLVYQPKDSADVNLYTATFSNVGLGNGNYIQINSSANGRVYAWVAPKNGIPQGEFEPVVALVAPIRQQFATLAANYQLATNTTVNGEVAYSQFDNNTFSDLDKKDDDAYGSFIAINDSRKLKDSTFIEHNFSWEQVSKGFAFIERYRKVEFDRLWTRGLSNPNTTRINGHENIFNLQGKFRKKNNNFSYELPIYTIDKQFFGYSPTISGQKQLLEKLQTNFLGNVMASAVKDSLKNNAYLANLSFAYAINPLSSISLFGKVEENQSVLTQNDSLTSNAFHYENVGVNLQTAIDKIWKIGLQADYRKDNLPINNKFTWASDAYNVGLQVNRQRGSKRIALVSNARFLTQNTAVFGKANEQFLLQRLEYQDNNVKKGYQLNVYVQSGTGREQKREFVFLEVPAGQGQYAWIDYNGNGVRELNEFEISVFKDQAKFIRVYNLTNDFIQSNQHETNLSLKLRPAAWFKNSNATFLQNISNQSNVRIDQQNTSKQLFLLNPLKADTQILSGNNLIRNTLLYNGSNVGVEITDKTSSLKQLLTYGSEQNTRTEHILKTRYNITSQWQIDAGATYGKRKLENKFFENRNYQWQEMQYTGTLTRQVIKQRLSLIYTYVNGDGSENGADSLKLKSHNVQVNYFYNVDKKTSMDAMVGNTNIAFNGNASSPLGFQILSGLVQGKNYNWAFNLRTLINKNIQFTFGYEGRKLPELAIIHIGRMEARYLF